MEDIIIKKILNLLFRAPLQLIDRTIVIYVFLPKVSNPHSHRSTSENKPNLIYLFSWYHPFLQYKANSIKIFIFFVLIAERSVLLLDQITIHYYICHSTKSSNWQQIKVHCNNSHWFKNFKNKCHRNHQKIRSTMKNVNEPIN